MPSLILFRHGKSDWKADFDHDRERPLAQRGLRAARVMGEFLAASKQVPPLAWCSPAKRAHDTLDYAKRQGHWRCNVETKSALYRQGINAIIDLLHSLNEAPDSVLLVGHEPDCSELVQHLIGGQPNLKFPTGAMARIDFDCESWSQIQPGQGQLRWLVPPKVFSTDVQF